MGGWITDLAIFYILGITLVVVGIVVIVAAVIRASLGNEKKRETHTSGVIMIGPFPIVFGTGKKSLKEVLILTLALAVVALIVMIVYYLFLRE